MNIKKEYEKFFERKKNDLCVHDAEDVIAFAKHYQALQLLQTGVSGSLLDNYKSFTKELLKDKEKCNDFFTSAGIIDKDGSLNKNYR